MFKSIFVIFFLEAMVGCSAKLETYRLINFATLTLPKAPHYCLVYTKKKAGDPKRQRKAPTYDVSVNQLVMDWQKMLSHQPRIKLVKEEKTQHHFQYVQRSRILRFPDIIDVQFVSQGSHRTQLYLYSRSVYGYSDMGVNCRRVDQWLSQISTKLSIQ